MPYIDLKLPPWVFPRYQTHYARKSSRGTISLWQVELKLFADQVKDYVKHIAKQERDSNESKQRYIEELIANDVQYIC